MHKRNFSFRIDEEVLSKLRFIAMQEKRSVSSQIRFLVRRCIRQHEKKYGEIKID